MYRRLAALSALPVIAGLGVAVTAPAGAATTTPRRTSHRALLQDAARLHQAATGTPYGTCKLVVPSAIHLSTDAFVNGVTLTGGCALHGGISAAWYAGGDTYLDSPLAVLFDHDNTEFSEDLGTVGVVTWKGWFAFDDQQHTYTQNAPQTTIKVGSWAGLQTSRSGGKVTVNTRAVRFATSLYRNIPWAGETGVIQYRAKGGVNWTDLKSFTTDAAGAVSYSYATPATRDYRAVYYEQTYVWGATSPTSQR